MQPPPPSRWVPPDARRQSGLFTSRQALAAGMTTEQVRHRRRTGRWVVHAGAALRHRDLDPDPFADVWAVALTWPDAVACLTSAARAHRLPVTTRGAVHAVVPHSRRLRANAVPTRYQLREDDVVRVGGTAFTTLPRTVFDCLGLLPEQEAEGMLIWVLTRRVVEHGDLVRLLDQNRHLAGNVQRRKLLGATRGGAMGVAEQKLHTILRRASIVGWEANQRVRDEDGIIGVVDVLFPAVRLVVEVDGHAYHGADRFQDDRTRQNRLTNAGYAILRFTWADLTQRPESVRSAITAALRRARIR